MQNENQSLSEEKYNHNISSNYISQRLAEFEGNREKCMTEQTMNDNCLCRLDVIRSKDMRVIIPYLREGAGEIRYYSMKYDNDKDALEGLVNLFENYNTRMDTESMLPGVVCDLDCEVMSVRNGLRLGGFYDGFKETCVALFDEKGVDVADRLYEEMVTSRFFSDNGPDFRAKEDSIIRELSDFNATMRGFRDRFSAFVQDKFQYHEDMNNLVYHYNLVESVEDRDTVYTLDNGSHTYHFDKLDGDIYMDKNPDDKCVYQAMVSSVSPQDFIQFPAGGLYGVVDSLRQYMSSMEKNGFGRSEYTSSYAGDDFYRFCTDICKDDMQKELSLSFPEVGKWMNEDTSEDFNDIDMNIYRSL